MRILGHLGSSVLLEQKQGATCSLSLSSAPLFLDAVRGEVTVFGTSPNLCRQSGSILNSCSIRFSRNPLPEDLIRIVIELNETESQKRVFDALAQLNLRCEYVYSSSVPNLAASRYHLTVDATNCTLPMHSLPEDFFDTFYKTFRSPIYNIHRCLDVRSQRGLMIFMHMVNTLADILIWKPSGRDDVKDIPELSVIEAPQWHRSLNYENEYVVEIYEKEIGRSRFPSILIPSKTVSEISSIIDAPIDSGFDYMTYCDTDWNVFELNFFPKYHLANTVFEFDAFKLGMLEALVDLLNRNNFTVIQSRQHNSLKYSFTLVSNTPMGESEVQSLDAFTHRLSEASQDAGLPIPARLAGVYLPSSAATGFLSNPSHPNLSKNYRPMHHVPVTITAKNIDWLRDFARRVIDRDLKEDRAWDPRSIEIDPANAQSSYAWPGVAPPGGCLATDITPTVSVPVFVWRSQLSDGIFRSRSKDGRCLMCQHSLGYMRAFDHLEFRFDMLDAASWNELADYYDAESWSDLPDAIRRFQNKGYDVLLTQVVQECQRCGWWVQGLQDGNCPATSASFAILNSFDINDERILDLEIIRHLERNYSDIFALSPRKFEEIIKNVYRDLGYEARLTKQSRDGGVDIFCYENNSGKICIVECKRYAETRTVGIGAIDRLIGATIRSNADTAHLVTSSNFTRPAREAAIQAEMQGVSLKLIDGHELLGLLGAYSDSRISLPEVKAIFS